MNIGVDIDDTLAATREYFMPFVAEYFGVDEAKLWEKHIFYDSLPEEWAVDRVRFYRTYFDRVVPDTPFKQDAAWAIDTLRSMGHRIIIITARTEKFYTDPYATSEEELRRGGIVYDKLICTPDKNSTCIQEKIDVLIDDLPVHCDGAAALGIRVIRMRAPYIQDPPDPYPAVSNWKEAVEAVRKLA